MRGVCRHPARGRCPRCRAESRAVAQQSGGARRSFVEKDLPSITVSVGVAAFPDAGNNPQLVLKAADEALYRAKEKGRNRVERSGTGTAGLDMPTAHHVAMQPALAPSFYVPATAEDEPAPSLIDAC
jgi:Diguanylate cyclase, GGDEF domain